MINLEFVFHPLPKNFREIFDLQFSIGKRTTGRHEHAFPIANLKSKITNRI